MHSLIFALVLAVFLTACATKQDPRLVEFKSGMATLHQRQGTGQITQLEHSQGQLALIQRLFPERSALVEYASYLVMVDTRAARGEISSDEREYLKAKKWAEYEEAVERSRARTAPTVPPVIYQPPSAGTTYNRIGNSIYGSDGSRCNIIGASMYCN